VNGRKFQNAAKITTSKFVKIENGTENNQTDALVNQKKMTNKW
jgi:hypothetical protein